MGEKRLLITHYKQIADKREGKRDGQLLQYRPATTKCTLDRHVYSVS